MPTCRLCATEKPDVEFHVRRDTGRHRTDCIKCRANARDRWTAEHPEVRKRAQKFYYKRNKKAQSARARAWAVANPQKVHATHLKRTFGISSADYAAMLGKQHDCCAACGKPESVIDTRSGKIRRLHVDHDHRTGQVRGLICTRCNMATGFLQDDPIRADAIAAYLRAKTNGIKVMEVA